MPVGEKMVRSAPKIRAMKRTTTIRRNAGTR